MPSPATMERFNSTEVDGDDGNDGVDGKEQ